MFTKYFSNTKITPKVIELTEEIFTPIEVGMNYNYNNSTLSNKFSKTFSDIAASWGRTECLNLLITFKGDLQAKWEHSPLVAAAQNGHLKVFVV